MKLKPEIASGYFQALDRLTESNAKTSAERAALLRKQLDLLCRDLTAPEAQSFSDLMGRLSFICTRYPLPETLPGELHETRKLGNKAVHTNETIGEEAVRLAIAAVTRLIQFFTDQPLPQGLQQLLVEVKGKRLAPASLRPAAEYIEKLKVVVLSIGPLYESNQGGHYAQLHCRDIEGELGEVTIRVQDTSLKDGSRLPGQQFSEIASLAWKYAIVSFRKLRKIHESENRFATVYDTLVVLEPDYLMEPAELASNFFDWGPSLAANPYLLVLSRLIGMESASYLLVGTLANDLLDQLIRNANMDHSEAIRRTLRLRYLTAVRLGSNILNGVTTEIREKHYPHLEHFAARLRNEQTLIEPTFISSEYGLLGRLDLLHQHDRPQDQDIYELKSGGAPPMGKVNASHGMQVVCYHLLLDSVTKGARRGVSSVFYSKAPQEQLRNVTPTLQQIQHLISVRNQSLALLRQLEETPHLLWQRILSENGPKPPYKQGDFIRLEAALRDIDDESLAYFNTFCGFVQREIRAAKVGDSIEDDLASEGFAALWRLSRQEKIAANNLLTGLSFDRIEDEQTVSFFRDAPAGQVTNFRDGDICLIYPDDGDRLDPLGYQILKCRLQRMEPDRLSIRFNNPQADQSIFRNREHWVLEHDFQEKNYVLQLECLFEFVEANALSRQKVLGLRPPVFQPLPSWNPEAEFQNSHLTAKQRSVIERAVHARDFFLIQGPPGTGKTSTILTRIVQLRLKLLSEGMVVLAFTNRAVSEIERRLKEAGVSFLRIGAHGSDHSLDTQFADKNFREVEGAIRSTPVFIATVSSFLSARRDLFAIRKFNTLIVDEASQLLEPQLAGLLTRFECSILIGDQNQLPAVSIQREKTSLLPDGSPLAALGFQDLRTSLFERLWLRSQKLARQYPGSSWEKATDMLEDHFRMHAEIAALINPWYGGKLREGSDHQDANFTGTAPAAGSLERFLNAHRLVFFPSNPGQEDKCHPEEADRVAELLKMLKRRFGPAFNPDEHIGVITPWRSQIGLIRNRIAYDPGLSRITVDTVERFQGSERDIIIVSLALTKARQLHTLTSETINLLPEGEVLVDRKLNVTLSRAREQIILLGDPAILKGSPHYRQILSKFAAVTGDKPM